MKPKQDPPLTRRERALVTRRRMLRAAYELFCEHGYAGTTMDLIAARAGVAVQTLYFTFNTKSAMLEEALGAAITGFEHWDPRVKAVVLADPRKAFAEFHAWFPDFDHSKSAVQALRQFVDASLRIFERAAPLAVVQATAAASDPQVKAVWEIAEQRRVDGYVFVVELLAKRRKLRRGVTLARASDVLLTILSAQTYLQLTQGRGWSVDECRSWFLEVLTWQLFG
jgi:AcrR family transcriptional regulator